MIDLSELLFFAFLAMQREVQQRLLITPVDNYSQVRESPPALHQGEHTRGIRIYQLHGEEGQIGGWEADTDYLFVQNS